MRLTRLACVAIPLACAAGPLRADVKLPAVFGDHMVLQREAKAPLWGWADASEQVTVTAGDAKATATAGADGKWSADLTGLKASDKPMEVTIAGKNTITLHDVLVGDVWVCSGQSNMEFSLSGAHDAKDEIPKADHPLIRLFIVKKKIAFEPQTDCEGKWAVCTPESARGFSAVGYFFGRDIQEDQHVPVGMIGTYWGGTPAEAWTSIQGLEAHPELTPLAERVEKAKAGLTQAKEEYQSVVLPKWEKEHAEWEQARKQPQAQPEAGKNEGGSHVKAEPKRPGAPGENPGMPTVLFNGMIAPIVPYGIKGAIWYQGESNAGNPKEYRVLFPAMISDWRTHWSEGDFPFLWVQLANFMAREANPTQGSAGWPGLREAQAMTLKLPNTGEAVIDDIGQGDNIHPKDKLDVGRRLALAARHVAYGENLVYSGPMYDAMKVEGEKIRVTFKNAGSGLTIAAAPSTQPGVPPEEAAGELKGFSIAGPDHHFVWATATIDGDAVIVSSPEVKDPVAVRYAWANNPQANLYNKEGLPASPFRTDDWDNPPSRVK